MTALVFHEREGAAIWAAPKPRRATLSENDKPRRRGRPKGPCNPRELAQRRTAAWKHGGRAATALRRTVPPCRPDLCPLEDDAYPCSLKQTLDDEGRVLEVCVVRLVVDSDIQQAYLKAMDGDHDELRALAAQLVAAQTQLAGEQLSGLLKDGFALEQELFSGEGEKLGVRKVVNPAAAPTLKLLEMVGMTATQQVLTPKSRGESSRDEAAVDLLGFISGKNRALKGGGE